MAVLKILRMGNPVLTRRAEEVVDISAPEVGRLIADMKDTLLSEGGSGLAAPQVGAGLRLVVLRIPGRHRGATSVAQEEFKSLVNPVIEPLDEEMEAGWEACLSVPGLVGEVWRYRRVRCHSYDEKGAFHSQEAAGFEARILQHECDHLDGVLYPHHIRDMHKLIYSSELHHQGAKL